MQIFKLISDSLKHKAIVVLVCLSIVPVLILGFVTNYIVKDAIETKLNFMANQTIDKLSISISKDFQGFIGLAFYFSKNYELENFLNKEFDSEDKKQELFFYLQSKMNQNEFVKRMTYPYHYIVISKDGSIFTNFAYSKKGNYEELASKINNEEWFNNLKNSYSQQLWMSKSKHLLFLNGADQIYVASNVFYNFENVGIIILGIDEYYAAKLMDNVKISDKSSVFLTADNGKCMVEGESNYYPFNYIPDKVLNDLHENNEASQTLNISNIKQLIIHKSMYFNGINDKMSIIMITPLKDIYSGINRINYITLLLIGISLCVVIVLIIIFNKQVIDPVIDLNRLMSDVRRGNLNVKALENRKDEIGQLGNGFNNMIFNLKGYINNIQKEEKVKRELEIKMLQAQINPHFVRNTLNVIRWMAEIKKAIGVSRAITSFVRLLDYNFRDIDCMVTVKEELEYLKEYFYIQNLRFQNKYRVIIDVDDKIMDYKILKLSFQPIVENSIIHGLECKKGEGIVNVCGFIQEETLVFVIKDNGVGMDEGTLNDLLSNEKSKQLNRTMSSIGGIGLENVNQRIKLNFGQMYGIKIKSTKGSGTEVKIIFPLMNREIGGDKADENPNC